MRRAHVYTLRCAAENACCAFTYIHIYIAPKIVRTNLRRSVCVNGRLTLTLNRDADVSDGCLWGRYPGGGQCAVTVAITVARYDAVSINRGPIWSTYRAADSMEAQAFASQAEVHRVQPLLTARLQLAPDSLIVSFHSWKHA